MGNSILNEIEVLRLKRTVRVRKLLLLQLLVFILFTAMVHAEYYSIFLLGGQSNMDGRAPGADLPTSPVDLQAAQTDVLLYHGDAYGTAASDGFVRKAIICND